MVSETEIRRMIRDGGHKMDQRTCEYKALKRKVMKMTNLKDYGQIPKELTTLSMRKIEELNQINTN